MFAQLQPHRAPATKSTINNRAHVHIRPAEFNVAARLQNFSLLAWAVPVERLTRLIPASFRLEETRLEGQRVAWVSVASCVDEGVEQTAYQLHVKRNGEPAQWLLGISLGALSAVATRNLWSMPWHLSAMEVTEDHQQLSLRTQSQWANASWHIATQTETAKKIIHLETKPELPASLTQSSFNQYFQRRDGALGWRRAKLLNPSFIQAEVEVADCDLLRRLSILNADELSRPHLAIFQHDLAVQFSAPSLSAPSLLDSPTEIALKRAA